MDLGERRGGKKLGVVEGGKTGWAHRIIVNNTIRRYSLVGRSVPLVVRIEDSDTLTRLSISLSVAYPYRCISFTMSTASCHDSLHDNNELHF